MKLSLSLVLKVSLAIVGSIFASGKVALSQVTPDSTDINTQVNQNGNVAEITGGQTRGGNLFHSFGDFSVPTDNEAFFDNANDISNIFSRVTGGNISNIDGAIRANGSANLFLINPAGIIFGENARLDIGGSFYGSTATSILFEDGEFSVADLENPPILTVNAPIGLGFRDNPGDIALTPGSQLGISSTKTLALVGGNVSFDDGIIFPNDLRQLGSTVEIGGLTEAGTVGIEENGRLGFSEDVTRGDVSLVNSSFINVFSEGGGSVYINARNFELNSDGRILNGILPATSDFSTTESGEIVINATEDVTLDGANSDSVSISNDVVTTDVGQAGKITISGKKILLIDGGTISSNVANTANGRSSDVTLIAKENIRLSGTDGISSSSISNSIVSEEANGGEINLTAQNLTIESRAFIDSFAIGRGSSSNININVSDTVLIDGVASRIESSLGEGSSDEFRGVGNSGDINLKTKNLFVNNDGSIATDIAGRGDGGNIIINAENVAIDGADSEISTETALNVPSEQANQNDAGDIDITTNSLVVKDAGALSTSSNSIGDAGDISITARDSVLVNGTGESEFGLPSIISSDVGLAISSDVIGNSGNVEIVTPKLTVSDGGIISASTLGVGNSGNLTIRASEFIEVSNNAFIQADVFFDGTGTGGNLNIETPNLRVSNGGQISASTFGDGNAGNLTIRATDSINVTGESDTAKSGLFANALNLNGKGGELNIFTPDLRVNDSAIISVGNLPDATSTRDPGTGEAGDLNIQANSINIENGGSITAATQSSIGEGANINLQIADSITLRNDGLISAEAINEGNGGNLNIDTNFIVAFPGNNDIIASAEQGQGGNIKINAEGLLGIEERPLNDATNDINASSEFSLDGSVTINTPDVNPVQGVTELPTNIVVPEETVTQACQANRETAAKNGLNITGKGGVAPAPDLPLDSLNIFVARQSDNSESTTSKPTEITIGQIQPAQGIKVNKSGEVILTAYRTSNSGERLPEVELNCDS